ncbi:MAG: nicotinamide mononucleotide transporter [Bacteroidales bacterium]|nr:nicotinamide mononucleotide transporter [Bacteroidales bacterium]
MINWLSDNYIEILGVITSLVYLYFSYHQKIWLWPFGIISSALFIFIFYNARFYADMSLQGYYLVISIYGWYHWVAGARVRKEMKLPVTRTPVNSVIILSILFFILWAGIFLILSRFTDSDVPVGDAFTTAGGIIGTWMLARKKLENWLVWIIVDAVAALLYFYKGMYPTVILYIIFAVIALFGYLRWKKDLI